MGDDRVAGNVPGRRGRTHQANQARHRRRLDSVPSSVQRRAAHRDARPSEPRARDARGRARRAAVGRRHARHRSDDAARQNGRRPRRHSAAAHDRRAVQPQRLVVRAEQRRAADSAAAGKNSGRSRVDDFAVGDEDRGQIRRRRAVGRVVLRGRADGAADAMEFRRDLGEGTRADDRSREMANRHAVSSGGIERAGDARSRGRAPALAERVHRRDSRHAESAARFPTATKRPSG